MTDGKRTGSGTGNAAAGGVARGPLDAWGLAEDLGRIVALALVYYAAARLSLRFALVAENVTPLWPPTGIALVALLAFGLRIWPGIFLAAFAVNAPISDTLLAALATAAGNTLAPIIAGLLLRRVGFRLELDRVRDAVALVLLAALLSMTVSATAGTAALALTDSIPVTGFMATWSVWWAGDAMGVLIVAPFLLSLPRIRELVAGGWRRRLDAAILLIALCAVSALVARSRLPLLFLVLPLVGWAAWRYQQQGAAPAALLVSCFATWAAVTDRGPFAGQSLLEEMLTLQAFNAATAFTSFFFAALVTERRRAQEALERSAADLEDRVRGRTAELSETNRQLAREVAERVDAEGQLRRTQRLLSEAQEVARIGSWRWDIGTGSVQWSDEQFRIHGHEPGALPVTFASSISQVVDEDVPRIRRNVERALERGRSYVDDIEYRIVRPDGQVRVLLGKARLSFDSDGAPSHMVGTIEDITERREYEREHRIAETLQRALFPQELPTIEGLELAGKYVAGERGVHAGGDWYDAIPLADGSVALVIGDVSGHGLQAATVMGQVRMAVRAYALEGLDPVSVVTRTDALLQGLYLGEMVTMLYMVVVPTSLEARIVNAGHPPPVVVDPSTPPRYLETSSGVPLGIGLGMAFGEATIRLDSGSSLVLYTDGLVDRRDLRIDDGMERLLVAVTTDGGEDLETLCTGLVSTLVPAEASDDVAVLAARIGSAVGPLRMRIDADASQLSSLRRGLTTWAQGLSADREEVSDIVLACSEACTNSIEHAYELGGGVVEVEGTVSDGEIEMLVRDFGRWKQPVASERGRGLTIVRSLMDSVAVTHRSDGTDVLMRRRLRGRAGLVRSAP